MFNNILENKLQDLEKEFDYNSNIYSFIEEWARQNKPFLDEDLDTLISKLNKVLNDLYLYKKSLVVSEQKQVEKKVLDVLESHLEIEVAEPEVTLKF